MLSDGERFVREKRLSRDTEVSDAKSPITPKPRIINEVKFPVELPKYELNYALHNYGNNNALFSTANVRHDHSDARGHTTEVFWHIFQQIHLFRDPTLSYATMNSPWNTFWFSENKIFVLEN